MVKFLVAIGADPNAKDINGYTPLHFAVMYEQIKTMWMLIQDGSNVHSSCSSQDGSLSLPSLWRLTLG